MPDPSVLGPIAGFVFVAMGLVVKILWDLHKRADARAEEEAAFWRDIALKGLNVNDKAIEVAAKKTRDR